MVSISHVKRSFVALAVTLLLAGCATQQAPAPYVPGAVAPYEPAPRVVEAEPVYEQRVYREPVVVYVPRPYYYDDPFYHGPVFGAAALSNWSYGFHRRVHRADRYKAKRKHGDRKGRKGKRLTKEERIARREARRSKDKDAPIKRRREKGKKAAK